MVTSNSYHVCAIMQNCAILLSKLRMRNSELRSVIMSVDQSEQLSKDMVEQVRWNKIACLTVITMVTCKQLLKYVLTSEETELLNGHSEEYSKFAKADQFLYEMSQIHHYKERIVYLFYKKKFNERSDTNHRSRINGQQGGQPKPSAQEDVRGVTGIW